RADFGEFGTGRDLDTPTLIVGQVQVEAVDLVERDLIDEGANVGGFEPVAGDVEHCAAPGIAGCIDDPDPGDRERLRSWLSAEDCGVEQMTEGLDGPDEAVVIGCAEAHLAVSDLERVALRARIVGADVETERGVAFGVRLNRQVRTSRAFEFGT